MKVRMALKPNQTVLEVLTNPKLSPLQINVVLALQESSMSVHDLVNKVRKSNNGYKFVPETKFVSAIVGLQTKGVVYYG